MRAAASALVVAALCIGSSGALRAGAEPAAGAQPSDRGTTHWLVFVDDLHVNFVDTGRLRTLLRTLSGQLLQPGEHLSIAATLSSGTVERATTPDAAATAIRNISGHGLKPEDVLREGAAPDEAAWRELRSRALVSSTRAQRFIERAGPPTSARGLIYVSGGYFEDADIRTVLSLLAAVAIEHDTRIFAFDSRELARPGPPSLIAPDRWTRYVAESRGMLRHLAEDTGGVLLDGRQDLAQAMARVRRLQ
jgi:hypothetical protein